MSRSSSRSRPPSKSLEHGIIGNSNIMAAVIATVIRVASSMLTVLLLGESGTGKELLAGLIHAASVRKAGPMVSINCGALSEGLLEAELFGHEKGAFNNATTTKPGLFETADGGTLFLDEVGEMSPRLQVKLLRVLEEGTVRRVRGTRDITVDVRVVAATHRNLLAMVKARTFREDLYYRLAVYPIAIPPLRERDRDAVLIARYLLAGWKAKGRSLRLGRDAEQLILASPWPGNVRELRNVIDHAVVDTTGKRLSAEDIEKAMGLKVVRPSRPAQAIDYEQTILDLIGERGPQSGFELREALGLCKTTAARHLRGLRTQGLVVMQGKGRGTRYAIPEAAPPSVHEDLDLNDREREVLDLLVKRGPLGRRQVEEGIDLAERTALRTLNSLAERGVIEKSGKGRGVAYQVR